MCLLLMDKAIGVLLLSRYNGKICTAILCLLAFDSLCARSGSALANVLHGALRPFARDTLACCDHSLGGHELTFFVRDALWGTCVSNSGRITYTEHRVLVLLLHKVARALASCQV
jgi:hypothetical protein